MILHLVTDRLRLAPGTSDADALECLLRQVAYAVAAGVDVIQLRERDLDGRTAVDLARRAVAAARGSGTRVVVNERLDVALASRADGVHLRGDSLGAERVRALAPPGFLVGRSVHTAEEAAAAGPVDYLIAGTVWATPSKPAGHPLLGVDGLARIVRSTPVPVLAIGGIDVGRMPALARVGAAGIAAIGTWIGEAGPCAANPLDGRVQAYRAAGQAANMRTFPHRG